MSSLRRRRRVGAGLLITTSALVTALVMFAPRPGAGAPSVARPGGVVVHPVVTGGPGWDVGTGLSGTVPPPGTCRARGAGAAAMPDPSCTPGAVDAAVVDAGAAATVCRRGWSARLRPPEALTEPFKVAALRAYGERGPVGDYELDHLVPLELGGSSDTANLWPEPDDHPRPGVANSKDLVEHALHDLVCRGRAGHRLGLVVAQRLIAADWTTALARAEAVLGSS